MAPVKLIELKSEVMFALCRIERSGSDGVECPFVGGGWWPHNPGGAQSFSCTNSSSNMSHNSLCEAQKRWKHYTLFTMVSLLPFKKLLSLRSTQVFTGSQASGRNTAERRGMFRIHSFAYRTQHRVQKSQGLSVCSYIYETGTRKNEAIPSESDNGTFEGFECFSVSLKERCPWIGISFSVRIWAMTEKHFLEI